MSNFTSHRALLIDHKDNAKDNINDGDGDCCESHITSLTSNNSRKRKVTLLDYENDKLLYVCMSKTVALTYYA
jgi:hypothetical protein